MLAEKSASLDSSYQKSLRKLDICRLQRRFFYTGRLFKSIFDILPLLLAYEGFMVRFLSAL